MEPQRVGVAVITGAGGWRAQDVRTAAREAEKHGFDAIFTTEANSDTMTTAQVMGCATSRIQVGTWIANIYLRHPFTCAKGAELIADDTGGRFVLGLGVSHKPWNEALGIDMSHAAEDLPRYVRAVRSWLAGEGSNTYLPHGPAPVRVYVAALSMAAVERAAEIADGIMATMWPPERVAQSGAAIERGRAAHADLAPWTSPWACRRSSATTWMPCATRHADTSGPTRRSRSTTGCGARAASTSRSTGWSRAPGPPR
jgi:alkanesulfonate monooxygenase SsuD/methylene tetrahydromethanopterin reductase-like flavin-dependent oxidoreductase (luciferase family)